MAWRGRDGGGRDDDAELRVLIAAGCAPCDAPPGTTAPPPQIEGLHGRISALKPFDATTDASILLKALDCGSGRLGAFADRFFRAMSTTPSDYVALRQARTEREGIEGGQASARQGKRRD